MFARSFVCLFLFALTACGGGGDGGDPGVHDTSIIQKKLDEESNKLLQAITKKTIEANDSVGSVLCTPTHIGLAEAMVSTEIMLGLDEFNRWALASDQVHPSMKYEIGSILDNSTLPSRSEQAYLSALPCTGTDVMTSGLTISQAAISEILTVKDSLRRAGLLAP